MSRSVVFLPTLHSEARNGRISESAFVADLCEFIVTRLRFVEMNRWRRPSFGPLLQEKHKLRPYLR